MQTPMTCFNHHHSEQFVRLFDDDSNISVSICVVQVAFKTGDYKQQVVFIGGLTDGFMATEYVYLYSFPFFYIQYQFTVG
jgi:hypothetical protein